MTKDLEHSLSEDPLSNHYEDVSLKWDKYRTNSNSY